MRNTSFHSLEASSSLLLQSIISTGISLPLEPSTPTSAGLILPTVIIPAFPQLPRLAQAPALPLPSWHFLPLLLLFMCELEWGVSF